MTLRESEPEDREINLQLARLAATQQDVTEALRFYHNALYAPWPLEQADGRRDVRLELIRLLLDHNQAGRAISELLALERRHAGRNRAAPEGGAALRRPPTTTATRWISSSAR